MKMQIRVQDQTLVVESLHFTARLEGGLLVSLVDQETGTEFCRPATAAFPLDLVYMNRESVGAEPGFQRQAFAQAHPWGWGDMQPVHVKAAHPICSYLWSGHTRLIGYIELEPWNPRLDVSIAIHSKMGVLPTFVARERSAVEADILRNAHPGMKQILDWVRRERKWDDGSERMMQ